MTGSEARSRRDALRAPVFVYTLGGCGSWASARRLLHRRGIDFEEVSGDAVPGFRRHLAELTGRATVPQIVIGGEPIGGADALARLDRRGVLLPRVRGEEFPRAVVRRRLAPGRLLATIASALGGGTCGPWRYDVALVDRDGRTLERSSAGSAEEAELLAATLNG